LSDFINVHFKLQEHLFVAVSKRRSRVTCYTQHRAGQWKQWLLTPVLRRIRTEDMPKDIIYIS